MTKRVLVALFGSVALIVASVLLLPMREARVADEPATSERRVVRSPVRPRLETINIEDGWTNEAAWSNEVPTVHSLPPFESVKLNSFQPGTHGIEVPPPTPTAEAWLVGVVSPSELLLRMGNAEQLISLAGVTPPSECVSGASRFDEEAKLFLENMLKNEKLIVELQSAVRRGDKRMVSRARDQKNISATLIRNGYGCVEDGVLTAYCPAGWENQQLAARRNKFGLWQTRPPLVAGFVTEQQNAAEIVRRNLPR